MIVNDHVRKVESTALCKWVDRDLSRLNAAIEQFILPAFGADPKFYGYVSSETDITFKDEYNTFEKWKNANSDRASSAYASIDSLNYLTQFTISINFTAQELFLRFSSEAEKADEVRKSIENFKTQLNLAKKTAGAAYTRKNYQVVSRKYFADRNMTQDWFKSFFAKVKDLFQEPIYFNGDVKTNEGKIAEAKGEDVALWEESIFRLPWDSINEIYCWLHTEPLRITLRCDIRLAIVDISIETEALTKAESMIALLEKFSKLQKIEGDSYYYRKSEKYFKIFFKKSEFVISLRNAIENVVGTRPVLRDAYLEMKGPNEKDVPGIENFSDIELFFNRLKDAQWVHSAGLDLNGPRGALLTIYLRDKEYLTIYSHLPGDEFSQVIKLFSSLNPQPIKEESAPEGAGPVDGDKKSLKERIESNPIVWFISAMIVAFGTGIGAYEGIIRIAKLEVVRQGSFIVKDEHDKLKQQWDLERTTLTRTRDSLKTENLNLQRNLAKVSGQPNLKSFEIVKQAKDFDNNSQNVVANPNYGYLVTEYYNGPPINYPLENEIYYTVDIPVEGNYNLIIEYAAAEIRTVTVEFNDDEPVAGVCSAVTRGWDQKFVKRSKPIQVSAKAGVNKLLIRRTGSIPHLRAIHFIPVKS